MISDLIVDWNAAIEWAMLVGYVYACFWADRYLERLYWRNNA